MEDYMSIIDELIEDENKVVTYKMLSHQLALPVNKTKEILELYLKSFEASNLSALYTLTGMCNHKLTITIVPVSNLEKAKLRFEPLLSCHIYSIQKAKLKDPTILYGVDYDLTKKALYQSASFSMIKYNGAKQLSEDEVKELRFSNKSNGVTHEEVTLNQTLSNTHLSTQNSTKISGSFFSPKPSSKEKKNTQSQKQSIEDKHDTETESVSRKSPTDLRIHSDLKTTSQKSNKKSTGIDMFLCKGKSNRSNPPKESVSKSPPTIDSDLTDKQPSPCNQTFANISLNDSELVSLAEKMEYDDFDTSEKVESKAANDVVSNENRNFNDAEEATMTDEASSKLIETKNATIKIESTNPIQRNDAINNTKSTKAKSLSRKPKLNRNKSNGTSTIKKKRIKIVSSSSESDSEEEKFDHLDVIPPSPPPSAKVFELPPKNSRKKR